MPIETICQGCAKKLRVPDEYAGNQARCPACGTIYTVPGGEASFPAAHRAEQAAQPPTAPTSPDTWRLKTSDGAEYGPVLRVDLEAWVAEGRVPPDALISQGSQSWRSATDYFPHLASLQNPANPFSDQAAPAAADPYVTPGAAGGGRGHVVPHRGALILILGILAVIPVPCCTLLGPAAWIMGYTDLGEIKAGRMDASGRGQTQAGMVLGIVGTVWLLLWAGGSTVRLARLTKDGGEPSREPASARIRGQR